jgi:hypothetical protein
MIFWHCIREEHTRFLVYKTSISGQIKVSDAIALPAFYLKKLTTDAPLNRPRLVGITVGI